MRIVMALLALCVACSAYDIPYHLENELLFSARQADIGEYGVRTGVVVKETVIADPHFACLRLAIWGAVDKTYTNPYWIGSLSYIDRISCLPNSHTSYIRRLIKKYEISPKGEIYQEMRKHLAYEVVI